MSNVSSEPDNQNKGFPARGPQVPWEPASAVVVTVIAYICALVLASLILVYVLSFLGVGGAAAEAWLNSVAGQFYFVLISNALILAIIWFFLRGRRARLSHLGLGRRPVWKDLGFALLGYAAYFVLLAVAINFVSSYTNVNVDQKQELGFESLFNTGEKLMAFASLVLLAPVVEELIFRGFVFAGLRKAMKFFSATIITSILFAAPHLPASSEGLLWVAGLDTLVLSFILCYLRERTGALWAPITVHAIKNGLAFVLLLSSVAAP